MPKKAKTKLAELAAKQFLDKIKSLTFGFAAQKNTSGSESGLCPDCGFPAINIPTGAKIVGVGLVCVKKTARPGPEEQAFSA